MNAASSSNPQKMNKEKKNKKLNAEICLNEDNEELQKDQPLHLPLKLQMT